MEKKSIRVQAEELSRRELLGRGAVLVGAAAAGLALQPSVASGETNPNIKGMRPETKSAAPSMLPNLNPPVVQVQGGKLRGFRDGKTTIFLGIPYADAGRFELPKPVKPWDGVKSAQAWGPVCPIQNMTVAGVDEFVFPHRYWVENEHCQVLNIWSQDLAPAVKKPVMVWMHGGQFTNGSSMESYAYEGKNLSEFGDVVVVSLNHRLNIIGTLDLSAYGAEYAQSRYTGTADLVAALQWVHENIANFGGDPGNVTIFGQSGGGSKTARMMHIPAAKGLFHKVVCQSGGGEVLTDQDPEKNSKITQRIAAVTLANLNLTGDQIDKLKAVPYQQLVDAGDAALVTVAKEMGMQRLSYPVYADDKYVMRSFCDWTANVPLLYGNVFSEFQGNLQKRVDKNAWTEQEVAEKLKAAYGARQDGAVGTFKETFPGKKVQDLLFLATPNPRALVAKRESGKAPVFNYFFTYEYPVDGGILSFHTSEIAFVFHNLHDPQVRIATGEASEGYALQDKISRAWINFAHTGNPSQAGLDWKPYTKEDPQTMVFDTTCGCRNLHYDKLIAAIGEQNTQGPAPAPRT